MKLYHSEKHFPFQEEMASDAHGMDAAICVADTGLGKSHVAMMLAARLLEEDAIDIAFIICEKQKILPREWPGDIEKFMSVSWANYATSPAKREKIREDLPQLIVATFDAIKADAAIFPTTKAGNKGAPKPGPLLEALKGKRALVVFDEVTRISERKSVTYKAIKLFVDTLRQEPGCKVIALTASPNNRDLSSAFNLCRILDPSTMPRTVEEFETSYVSFMDDYGVPKRFKNKTASDTYPGVIPFDERIAPLILRKRKSDPDVVDYFPYWKFMEPTFVPMNAIQQEFYDAIDALSKSLPKWQQRAYTSVLRQIAGHPYSLVHAEGEIAKSIVEKVTPEGLARIGSPKTAYMLAWCKKVVIEQGEQAIIFTFFADSILPLLEEQLKQHGYSVSVNSGKRTEKQNGQAQADFRDGKTQIFLSSDAGSKGINLPEAGYLLHYDVPSTHTTFTQRSSRFHRIDSKRESVFVYSLITAGTIEEGYYQLGLSRNKDQDEMLGDDEVEDEQFVTAKRRRQDFFKSKEQHAK